MAAMPVMADEISVAVRANKGVGMAFEFWQPTIDVLNQKIPQHHFTLVPFENNSALNQAVSTGDYDFVFTNPASAVEHRIRYGYQPLATLFNKRAGKGYSRFGSVIFTRADRDDVNTLQDLKGKIFMAVDELGFGGWRIAWREMLSHGFDPYQDFSELRFAGGIQQRVVQAVLNGEVDAGSVRSDMLERMADRGQITLSNIKVINPKHTEGFPFMHSTPLYPEWLFSAKKDIPDELKSKVAIALLTIKQEDKAAMAGKYVGWVSPLDYGVVDELMKELAVGPYRISKEGMLGEFIKQYLAIIVVISILVAALIIAFVMMVYQNRRISNTRSSLQNEINSRKLAEQVLSSLAQQSLDSAKDESFFNTCLINLSQLFSARFAFIGLYADEAETHIRTYAVWAGDRFVDNFEYALEGTPCQDVINLEVELVGDHAREKYPDDEMLAQMGIESYFGAPLISPNGVMMGLISVMDTAPMRPDQQLRPILKIFSNRIALEIQRKKEEEQLQMITKQLSYQASHDSLTGLVNRRAFEEKLLTACVNARETKKIHALCYIDMDQFKVVNDTCGHGAGDELLRQLSGQLARVIRGSDTLGRLGGDEFGVLLFDCDLERAEEVAEKLLETVKSFRFAWQDNIFDIGVSIGVVPINQYRHGVDELLQAADAACYVAKEHGRNRIYIYREDDQAISEHRGYMRWVTEINRAIKEEGFVLYRQCIESAKQDMHIKDHYEILLRMRGESGKMIAPGVFITVAERYNLMLDIDKWVIENSFKYISQNHPVTDTDTDHNFLYHLNLSGLTISSDTMFEFIDEMRVLYNISPDTVCFEITETAAVTNFTQAVNFIEKLKNIGFDFALDDFGSGVCSYAYLRNIPVKYLKIDGHFVSDVLNDPTNRVIIESIVKIAQVLNVHTIAEWVDCETVKDELIALGVDYIQGYHIGHPEQC